MLANFYIHTGLQVSMLNLNLAQFGLKDPCLHCLSCLVHHSLKPKLNPSRVILDNYALILSNNNSDILIVHINLPPNNLIQYLIMSHGKCHILSNCFCRWSITHFLWSSMITSRFYKKKSKMFVILTVNKTKSTSSTTHIITWFQLSQIGLDSEPKQTLIPSDIPTFYPSVCSVQMTQCYLPSTIHYSVHSTLHLHLHTIKPFTKCWLWCGPCGAL